MEVRTFPQCCGAGVLVIEHLTGKGETEDLELIRSWVYYARRNGYRMYDFPDSYGGKSGDPRSSKAVLGGPTDQKGWNTHNSWGMLLAITNPGQKEVGTRLAKFGFKELLATHNPVYGSGRHEIVLWGLDLNDFKEAQLKPGGEPQVENAFATMTGTLGCLANKQPRGPDGRFVTIAKAPVPA